MKKSTEQQLYALKGCIGCAKDCQFNSMVASKEYVAQRGKQLYPCNSSIQAGKEEK